MLGKFLKKQRERVGLTQAEVAEMANVSRELVKKNESKDGPSDSASGFYRYLMALGLVDELDEGGDE